MASQVSLPATPQTNTSYDTYMQSLQQKLSSISMQNASTLGPLSPQTTLISAEKAVIPSLESTLQLIDKLHVDSSAPSSGTATTEMLSPVREFENAQFPLISPPPSTNETPKHIYKNLNNELSKINSRKDSTATSPDQQQHESSDSDAAAAAPSEKPIENLLKSPEKLETKSAEKTRRVSRFKVSVVVEPDPSKLIIQPENQSETTKEAAAAAPPKDLLNNISAVLQKEYAENLTLDQQVMFDNEIHTALKQVPSLQDIPSSFEGIRTAILDSASAAAAATTDIKMQDSLTIINNTMQQLQENVQTSYLSQAKTIIASVPIGWIAENQHAVGTIHTTTGNTAAHVKIERKISMDNLKSKTSTTLKKSLSYNDLANEIANLFSKPSPKLTKTTKDTIGGKIDPVVTSSNPRKISGGRRMSKTFRRTPTIIIHPPEECFDRITNSCPNIHALIFKENGGISTCQNLPLETVDKDEMNHSCPDINILTQDCNFFPNNIQSNLSRSCPSINTLNDVNSDLMFSNNLSLNSLNDSVEYFNHFNYEQQQKPMNISFTECLNELDALKNEVNDIKKECECLLFGCSCETTPKNECYQRTSFKSSKRNKTSKKLLYQYLPNRPEQRKVALNKQDSYTRTVSEPNIFKNINRNTNYNRSFSEINKSPKKSSPKKHDISPTEILKHKIKQSLSMYDLNSPQKQDENYDNYFTIHGGMKLPNDFTDFTLKNYVETKKERRELDKDNNLLAIVKCCCGLENCQNGRLQVVPITFQQLMDSNCEYNMNETFEDMLSRQQAELNALIEAHRKQQIEYMKSITEVSKNSASKKES